MNNLSQDEKVFRFHTGFNEQFYCLLEFLGEEMSFLSYWESTSARQIPKMKA